MIKKLFKKESYTKELFLQELFKHDYDEKLLSDMLNSDSIDLNYKDENGDTFLHTCIKKSKFKSAVWLAHNQFDVQERNNDGKNALDLAIDKENIQVVHVILSLNKIDINQKDDYGRILLQDLVVLGYNDIAKLFIEYGSDINSKDKNGRNVIFDALSYGNEKFIEHLLSTEHLELNNSDINNETIMHHPQVVGDDNRAIKLLEAGADPTIQNGDGETYLCSAALRGMDAYHIVDTALKQGADVNSRVANNNTILMELVAASSTLTQEEIDRRKSLVEMSKNFLMNGIDIDAIDENNETALFRAIRVSDIELVSFLLSAGINPNIQNIHFQTVLNLAVYEGIKNLDIILLLLKFKADPNIKNQSGQTLYEILNNIILHTHGKLNLEDQFILSKIRQDGQHIVLLKELLAQNKEDLNYQDSTGNPLFFNPLLNDHFHLFKLYIKYGLDIHNKNINGHSVFFEYVFRVFQDDNLDIDFQNNVSMLLSAKLDHNYQDQSGYTIVHKILGTKCNLSLFDILTQVVLFDYNLTDKLGRSVMHTAVWHNKAMVMRRIHLIDPNIANIPDDYGILPITYAALLGSQELVLLFISLGANVKSGLTIPDSAIKQFSPMLKNLDKLQEHIDGEDVTEKMRIVVDQVKRDFKVL